MNDTPKTDAAREWYERGDNYQYALPVADTDMAKLERELAAMTAAKNKAVEALNDLFYNLEESQSTSDTLAALLEFLPAARVALDKMEAV